LASSGPGGQVLRRRAVEKRPFLEKVRLPGCDKKPAGQIKRELTASRHAWRQQEYAGVLAFLLVVLDRLGIAGPGCPVPGVH